MGTAVVAVPVGDGVSVAVSPCRVLLGLSVTSRVMAAMETGTVAWAKIKTIMPIANKNAAIHKPRTQRFSCLFAFGLRLLPVGIRLRMACHPFYALIFCSAERIALKAAMLTSMISRDGSRVVSFCSAKLGLARARIRGASACLPVQRIYS